ncbi:sodium:proton antiporter [Pseudactinotalea sp. HY158]|uniref:cation:proton antiporter n=1 Tax=Pseudactinotalea sp. HY158 TaxID=2654547 RepID=UPI00129C2FA8|nr:cation:proton antiporter [Pseudactinotalea sp. HY158]QGH69747.1 sodium:proton antiporter [Pseudactinotalea sp. HY158]
MDAFLIVSVLGLLVIAAATLIASRVGVASPLLLVVLGLLVSLVPAVPEVTIAPEWILAGVLPPLLYSAAASMPSLDFRREFTAIGSLSVVLVIVSALLTGLFFTWVIPGLSLAWGIALGAIVSPTDAVATSIVKRTGISPRVITMLEGEGLLNDATALVLLRAAIAATAAAVSIVGVAGSFALAVAVAAAVGFAAGRLNLAVRSRVSDPTVSTVLSFTVPFLASVPAELLHGSGLFAAVIAGLVTGRGAVRRIPSQHRLAEQQNWRTIELLLEGGVFLLMGLELTGVLDQVIRDHDGYGLAIGAAAGALGVTVAVRTGYVALLVASLGWRARRHRRLRPRLDAVQERISQPGADQRWAENGRRGRRGRQWTLERVRVRVARLSADIDYFLARPFGWREGTVVVWAGMRGVVTVAAAQTLPADTPHRSLLVLIAFIVAAGSLLLQGSSLGAVIRWAKPDTESPVVLAAERRALRELLEEAAAGAPAAASQLAVLAAQRDALLDARDSGRYSSAALSGALEVLDAEQVRLELLGEG